MTEQQQKFLDLFIDMDESFCVSHNPFAYLSTTRENISKDEFWLKAPEDSEKMVDSKITFDMINMLAINPINGPRKDQHCTAFRGFLVEMDDGKLKDQMEYIEKLGMPYSCCVFSGSKSLHFGIVLDTPLPSLTSYRMVSRWILNVVKRADQQTLNPSRGIRFPGNLRRVYGEEVVPMADRKEQKLLKLNNRISQAELFEWLNKFKDEKPIIRSTKNKRAKGAGSLKNLSPWAKKEISNDIPAQEGRNKTWYALGYDFYLAGYSLDDTFSILEAYFVEEHDFSRREWEYTVTRGYRTALEATE